MKYLFIISVFFCNLANAFDITELSVNQKFMLFDRNPYINDPFTTRTGIILDFDIIDGIFIKNFFHTETDPMQYRGVGWHWQAGLRPIWFLELGWDHHSTHLLDVKDPRGFFVEDGIFLKVNLLEPKQGKGIFK